MSHSPQTGHLEQARQLLDSVRGKTLSPEDREKKAVDLAALLLEEANSIQTFQEKILQGQLARMMQDPNGKAFTTCMTDQCFRSHNPPRVANQMVHLLDEFGVPKYLSWIKRAQLFAFKWLGKTFSYLFVPLATMMLRKETSTVILPGEPKALSAHMEKRRKQGVRLNLNHLGEAILGEEEAKRRLDIYINDLKQDDIEYISIKISTIYSQIHLLGWEKSIEVLAERLRQLYRVAKAHTFTRVDGSKAPKFVNLDMEEYKDLVLTKELFKKVLNEPEFEHFSAGIVLQAYLPDSFEIQKELTEWAVQRVKRGGAPIKIRIVKGANLAMEQFEASLRGWAQAPYTKKSDVDANYKRMVTYGCKKEYAHAVHLGIGSHNLFDIAYAMVLREEHGVQHEYSFEMLEGMADHIRRVVQMLVHDILLYCPVATKEDFQSAVAYLIRRLDENTGPDNFLRSTFGLKPHTPEWEKQTHLFQKACHEMHTVYATPRRQQNRNLPPYHLPLEAAYENEADTDFALPQNRKWAEELLHKWKKQKFEDIPAVVAGKEIHQNTPEGIGVDPNDPTKTLYRYSMLDWSHVDEALNTAKKYEAYWGKKSVEERCKLLHQAAKVMREKRGDLIGVMVADGGKVIMEGDPEVSEAIDFAEYYLRSMRKMDACKDIQWTPKGTVLVTPPWNFPVSIPAGGILAALIAGNCVIFKPAPEAVLTGWVLVNALWEAGIPKEVLQFINCADDPVGSRLISDPRVNTVILTGATSTAKLFQTLRPGIDLAAETGGKNALIVTAMADRDLAIKDLVTSAFGHCGQKCSAASLGVIEAEVYDDPHFRQQLKDAVESITVGSSWNLSTKMSPLIREPGQALLRGLTSLDEGEEWLVKPKQDPKNPNLWTPGVKLGVKEGSFMHQTELFGPVLGLMRAKNLDHAIRLANGTPYGLTSGIQSLDDREVQEWIEKIEAGNCYVNRTITGAIVRRQPFGGCKASSYGPGVKAGGPDYVAQFAHPTQVSLPQEKHPVPQSLNELTNIIEKFSLDASQLGTWYGSISNYAYWANHFAKDHDPSLVVGQDNFLRYRKRKGIALRVQKKDSLLDVLRVIAAAISVEAPLYVSYTKDETSFDLTDQWKHLSHHVHVHEESEEAFLKSVASGKFVRVRLISPPSEDLEQAAAKAFCHLAHAPVLANGRFELLHFLREIALSIDYHRYGNLGVREGEKRHPVL